jgi:hypothetical protein
MWLETTATDTGDIALSRRFLTLVLFPLLLVAACSGKITSPDEFRRAGEELNRCARDIAERNKEIRDLLQAYNQTVPTERRLLVSSSCGAMTAVERGKLASQQNVETDESCRSVLDRIREIDVVMQRSRDRFNTLAARLPDPHRVRRGENHYQICLSYLTQERGLARGAADSIMARVRLTSDLYEGFDVWMLYAEHRFQTFVTQGDARIAPSALARAGAMFRE